MRRLVVLVSAIVFLDAMLFGALIPLVPGVRRRLRLSASCRPGLLVGAFGGGRGPRRHPRRHHRRPRRAEERGHQRAPAARARELRLALADSPRNRRHRPLPPGPLERDDVGRRALLVDRVDAARAARPAPRHGLRDRGARRDPRPDGRGRSPSSSGSAPASPRIGVVALLLAVAAVAAAPPRGRGRRARAPCADAFADPAFVAGLWLNALPALFFGVLDVLAPLALDAGGYGAIAIGAVFLVAGLIETALNPLLGRLSDRRGRLLPIRWALCASIVVGDPARLRRRPRL